MGKLKEPGRVEPVGSNLLVFIASSALAYTSGGYCPPVPAPDGGQLFNPKNSILESSTYPFTYFPFLSSLLLVTFNTNL